MGEFQKRNPNLYVFSAHLHMDEQTPHLHINFVPYVRGSKRGLAVIMERYGVKWLQKGTHEKHLSVLDFKKQEQTKEVADLDIQKQKITDDIAKLDMEAADRKNWMIQYTDSLKQKQPSFRLGKKK